jgi:ubiquinone/menaquinone biosynthesis C-methylase UbiE
MRKSSIKKLIIKVGGMKLLNKLTILKWLLKLKMNRYKNEKEMYLLADYIFNGDVCIDIGANYGAYTYELSKIVGITGKVYSFEPGKFAFNVLS